jgi:MFS family permease
VTSREKSILAAVSLCHGLVHAYMLVFPTIYYSLGSALELKFSGVGFIGMASYMAFGFGALPAGFLADKVGARRLLSLCVAGTTVSSVVAFTAREPATVVVALVLMGLSASLYHPAGLSLLSTSIKDLGKALGIHGMAGTVGEAGAPLLAGLLTARFGWNYSYLALGVLGTGVLVLVNVVFRRAGRSEESHAAHGAQAGHDAHRAHAGHKTRDAGGERSGTAKPRADLRILGGDLAVIYAMGVIYGLTYRVLITFFPSHLSGRVEYIGDDVKRLGLVSSSIMVISLVGPILGGYLATSRSAIERNLLVVFSLIAAAALGFYFLAGPALVLVAIPAVLLIFCFQPLQNVMLARASHASVRGRVYGINYAVSAGIGAAAAGVGGIFGERFGVQSVFLLMLGLCAAEIVLIATSRYVRLSRGARGDNGAVPAEIAKIGA